MEPVKAYCQDLQISSQTVLPDKADDVGQVQGEVDDSTAGSCQICFGEEGAEQETLHYGGCGECQQEQKEQNWIAIMQHLSMLQAKGKQKNLQVLLLSASRKGQNCH